MLKNLIVKPYELARAPLTLVDRAVSPRLPEGSRSRAGLEWAMGSTDRIAGALLRNDEISRRGADRLDRFQKLASAERLEAEAEARRQQARQARAEGKQEAEDKRRAAEERALKALEDGDVAEARAKQEAKQRAAKTAATKKAAAAKKATARKTAAQKRQQAADSTSQARKKAAQKKTKAEIDDARERKAEADAARADADRLEELVDARKQERQES